VAAAFPALHAPPPVAAAPTPAERAALACPDPLATLDPAGSVLWANPAWERLLGEDLAGLVAPEERARLREALADPRGELELDVQVRGGRVRRILFSLGAAPGGLATVCGRDVTDSDRGRMVEALTLSQARYATLVRHLPDAAVVLFDGDLRVHMVEGALLPDAPALEGRLLAEILPPERAADLLPHFAAAAAGEPRSFDHERLDGSATYWTQIVPLARPDGAVFGGMAVFRDVTERRDAARALEAHARELERSNLELEQYASVASHDLSAPLRTVSGYLGLLRRRHGDALGPEGDALVAQAVEEAARMRALVDDLLLYARVGRAEPVRARVEPERLVAEVAEVLRAEAPDARIDCEPLPAVCGDPGLLRRLLQNLLGNAVKFVPEGRRPHVRVRACGDRFEVRDNGVGIPPEDAERVFGMFERLVGREDRPGTGMGLAIARKVVERHGGEIGVEPAPGGGSCVRFTLPLAQ
jgi:signal transduction histidine kinase